MCGTRMGQRNRAEEKWRMNKQENWFRMFFSSCCCWMQRILRVISLNFQFNFLPACWILPFHAISLSLSLLSSSTTTTTMTTRRRENVNMAIHMHGCCCCFSIYSTLFTFSNRHDWNWFAQLWALVDGKSTAGFWIAFLGQFFAKFLRNSQTIERVINLAWNVRV